MSRRTVIMLAATAIASLLWALRFVAAGALPLDLSDFFGGLACGLGIGAVVTWVSERTPPA